MDWRRTGIVAARAGACSLTPNWHGRSHSSDREKDMNVIVVGAGILGASAAYHLAREGCKVTLVDRGDDGRATAAGAGIICPWGSAIEDAASYALLEGGARYYHHLVALLAEDGEQDLGYARVGGLYVP